MHFVKPLDSDGSIGQQIICHLKQLAREVSFLMRAGHEHDKQDSIHEARRCLKVMIALIGLLRGAAPKSGLRCMHMRCKEALHRLGNLRDQHVIQQLIPKGVTEISKKSPVIDWRHVRKSVRLQMKVVRVGARDLKPRHVRRGACIALNRNWIKAAQSAHYALARPDATSLHALRRHAIRLRIQGVIISKLGGLPAKMLESLKLLCFELGEHHDLAMAMHHADDDKGSVMKVRSALLQRGILKRVRRIFGY